MFLPDRFIREPALGRLGVKSKALGPLPRELIKHINASVSAGGKPVLYAMDPSRGVGVDILGNAGDLSVTSGSVNIRSGGGYIVGANSYIYGTTSSRPAVMFSDVMNPKLSVVAWAPRNTSFWFTAAAPNYANRYWVLGSSGWELRGGGNTPDGTKWPRALLNASGRTGNMFAGVTYNRYDHRYFIDALESGGTTADSNWDWQFDMGALPYRIAINAMLDSSPETSASGSTLLMAMILPEVALTRADLYKLMQYGPGLTELRGAW